MSSSFPLRLPALAESVALENWKPWIAGKSGIRLRELAE